MDDIIRMAANEKDFCPCCGEQGHGTRECPTMMRKTGQMVRRMAYRHEMSLAFERKSVPVERRKRKTINK